MSESGERKNVFSVVDSIAKRREKAEQKIRDMVAKDSDKIDYSIFDNPDKIRRKDLVTKAGQILDLLKSDPSLSAEKIAAERKKLPSDFPAISYLITHFTHQQLIEEPNRFWAILDIFLEPLDSFAGNITNQTSAEADITARFKPKNVTVEQWQHLLAEHKKTLPEETGFEESLALSLERVKIMQTPNLFQLLDEYTRSEWGPGAPYLLALMTEYKSRRKLP
ncbi:MAG: hypothetical protein Q7S75_02665 [bacterium]|nr:hypothetical protein [bacterium]